MANKIENVAMFVVREADELKFATAAVEGAARVAPVYLDGKRLAGVYSEVKAGSINDFISDPSLAAHLSEVPAGIEARNAVLKKWSDAAKKASKAKKAGLSTVTLLSLAACGGDGGSSVEIKTDTINFDGDKVAITTPNGGAVVYVANASDDVHSNVEVTAAGSGTVTFDFTDASDVVELAGTSSISGFSTIAVSGGTVDFTADGLEFILSEKTLVLGSGAIVSFDQFVSLAAVGGTGDLAVMVAGGHPTVSVYDQVRTVVVSDKAPEIVDVQIQVEGNDAGVLAIDEYEYIAANVENVDDLIYVIQDTASNLFDGAEVAAGVTDILASATSVVVIGEIDADQQQALEDFAAGLVRDEPLELTFQDAIFALTTDENDRIVGTAGDDLIQGRVSNSFMVSGKSTTFQDGDSVNGNIGYNTLQLTMDAGTTADGVDVSNVEELDLRLTALGSSDATTEVVMTDWDDSLESISIRSNKSDLIISEQQSIADIAIADRSTDAQSSSYEFGYAANVLDGSDDSLNLAVDNVNGTSGSTVNVDAGMEEISITVADREGDQYASDINLVADGVENIDVIGGHEGQTFTLDANVASGAEFDSASFAGDMNLTSADIKNAVLGAGDDVVTINGTQAELSDSSYDLGAGSNTIDINSDLAGTITGEDGNDIVRVNSNSPNGSVLATGKIILNEGDNQVEVDGNHAGLIEVGSGDDTVTVGSTGSESLIELGAGDNTATVNAGHAGEMSASDGFDTISITGDVSGLIDVAAGGSNITAGSVAASGSITATGGADEITVAGIVAGSIAVGAGGSIISTGALSGDGSIVASDGFDDLTVASTAAGTEISLGEGGSSVVVEGAHAGTITTGTGSDADEVSAATTADGSTINVGGGDNFVFVGALVEDGGNATVTGGAHGGDIIAGAGNDDIAVGATGAGSLIQAGEGDNRVFVGTVTVDDEGEVTAFSGAQHAGDITTGSGDDEVRTGSVVGGSIITSDGTDDVLVAGDASNVTINLGGGDNNTLEITGNLTAAVPGTVTFGDGNENVMIVGGAVENDLITFGTEEDGTGEDATLSVGADFAGADVTFYGTDSTMTVGGDVTTFGGDASSITFGDGSNTLDVDGSVLGSDGDRVSISFGSGEDLVDVGTAGEDSIRHADIAFGEGSFALDVSGSVSDSSITAGAGEFGSVDIDGGLVNSSIDVESGSTLVAVSDGAFSSDIDLAGNSSVMIGSEGAFFSDAEIFVDSSISIAGGGNYVMLAGVVSNDSSIEITNAGDAEQPAFVQNLGVSDVDFQDVLGRDQVYEISADNAVVTGTLDASSISIDGGDNFVVVAGEMVDGASITLGDGADFVWVGAEITPWGEDDAQLIGGSGADQTEINLGGGDDILIFTAGDGEDSGPVIHSGGLIDGGAGDNDTLIINAFGGGEDGVLNVIGRTDAQQVQIEIPAGLERGDVVSVSFGEDGPYEHTVEYTEVQKVDITIAADTYAEGTTFTFSIDGEEYSYTVPLLEGAGLNEGAVATAIAAMLDADANFGAAPSGAVVTLTAVGVDLDADDLTVSLVSVTNSADAPVYAEAVTVADQERSVQIAAEIAVDMAVAVNGGSSFYAEAFSLTLERLLELGVDQQLIIVGDNVESSVNYAEYIAGDFVDFYTSTNGIELDLSNIVVPFGGYYFVLAANGDAQMDDTQAEIFGMEFSVSIEDLLAAVQVSSATSLELTANDISADVDVVFTADAVAQDVLTLQHADANVENIEHVELRIIDDSEAANSGDEVDEIRADFDFFDDSVSTIELDSQVQLDTELDGFLVQLNGSDSENYETFYTDTSTTFTLGNVKGGEAITVRGDEVTTTGNVQVEQITVGDSDGDHEVGDKIIVTLGDVTVEYIVTEEDLGIDDPSSTAGLDAAAIATSLANAINAAALVEEEGQPPAHMFTAYAIDNRVELVGLSGENVNVELAHTRKLNDSVPFEDTLSAGTAWDAQDALGSLFQADDVITVSMEGFVDFEYTVKAEDCDRLQANAMIEALIAHFTPDKGQAQATFDFGSVIFANEVDVRVTRPEEDTLSVTTVTNLQAADETDDSITDVTINATLVDGAEDTMDLTVDGYGNFDIAITGGVDSGYTDLDMTLADEFTHTVNTGGQLGNFVETITVADAQGVDTAGQTITLDNVLAHTVNTTGSAANFSVDQLSVRGYETDASSFLAQAIELPSGVTTVVGKFNGAADDEYSSDVYKFTHSGGEITFTTSINENIWVFNAAGQVVHVEDDDVLTADLEAGVYFVAVAENNSDAFETLEDFRDENSFYENDTEGSNDPLTEENRVAELVGADGGPFDEGPWSNRVYTLTFSVPTAGLLPSQGSVFAENPVRDITEVISVTTGTGDDHLTTLAQSALTEFSTVDLGSGTNTLSLGWGTDEPVFSSDVEAVGDINYAGELSQLDILNDVVLDQESTTLTMPGGVGDVDTVTFTDVDASEGLAADLNIVGVANDVTIESADDLNLGVFQVSIGTNPGTSNLTYDATPDNDVDVTPFTDSLVNDPVDDVSVEFVVGGRIAGATFVGGFAPGVSLRVPPTFSGTGDDAVDDRQIEIYHGTYNYETGIFTITLTPLSDIYPPALGEAPTHTLGLYDNDSTDNVGFVEGLVFDGFFQENGFIVENETLSWSDDGGTYVHVPYESGMPVASSFDIGTLTLSDENGVEATGDASVIAGGSVLFNVGNNVLQSLTVAAGDEAEVFIALNDDDTINIGDVRIEASGAGKLDLHLINNQDTDIVLGDIEMVATFAGEYSDGATEFDAAPNMSISQNTDVTVTTGDVLLESISPYDHDYGLDISSNTRANVTMGAVAGISGYADANFIIAGNLDSTVTLAGMSFEVEASCETNLNVNGNTGSDIAILGDIILNGDPDVEINDNTNSNVSLASDGDITLISCEESAVVDIIGNTNTHNPLESGPDQGSLMSESFTIALGDVSFDTNASSTLNISDNVDDTYFGDLTISIGDVDVLTHDVFAMSVTGNDYTTIEVGNVTVLAQSDASLDILDNDGQFYEIVLPGQVVRREMDKADITIVDVTMEGASVDIDIEDNDLADVELGEVTLTAVSGAADVHIYDNDVMGEDYLGTVNITLRDVTLSATSDASFVVDDHTAFASDASIDITVGHVEMDTDRAALFVISNNEATGSDASVSVSLSSVDIDAASAASFLIVDNDGGEDSLVTISIERPEEDEELDAAVIMNVTGSDAEAYAVIGGNTADVVVGGLSMTVSDGDAGLEVVYNNDSSIDLGAVDINALGLAGATIGYDFSGAESDIDFLDGGNSYTDVIIGDLTITAEGESADASLVIANNYGEDGVGSVTIVDIEMNSDVSGTFFVANNSLTGAADGDADMDIADVTMDSSDDANLSIWDNTGDSSDDFIMSFGDVELNAGAGSSNNAQFEFRDNQYMNADFDDVTMNGGNTGVFINDNSDSDIEMGVVTLNHDGAASNDAHVAMTGNAGVAITLSAVAIDSDNTGRLEISGNSDASVAVLGVASDGDMDAIQAVVVDAVGAASVNITTNVTMSGVADTNTSSIILGNVSDDGYEVSVVSEFSDATFDMSENGAIAGQGTGSSMTISVGDLLMDAGHDAYFSVVSDGAFSSDGDASLSISIGDVDVLAGSDADFVVGGNVASSTSASWSDDVVDVDITIGAVDIDASDEVRFEITDNIANGSDATIDVTTGSVEIDAGNDVFFVATAGEDGFSGELNTTLTMGDVTIVAGSDAAEVSGSDVDISSNVYAVMEDVAGTESVSVTASSANAGDSDIYARFANMFDLDSVTLSGSNAEVYFFGDMNSDGEGDFTIDLSDMTGTFSSGASEYDPVGVSANDVDADGIDDGTYLVNVGADFGDRTVIVEIGSGDLIYNAQHSDFSGGDYYTGSDGNDDWYTDDGWFSLGDELELTPTRLDKTFTISNNTGLADGQSGTWTFNIEINGDSYAGTVTQTDEYEGGGFFYDWNLPTLPSGYIISASGREIELTGLVDGHDTASITTAVRTSGSGNGELDFASSGTNGVPATDGLGNAASEVFTFTGDDIGEVVIGGFRPNGFFEAAEVDRLDFSMFDDIQDAGDLIIRIEEGGRPGDEDGYFDDIIIDFVNQEYGDIRLVGAGEYFNDANVNGIANSIIFTPNELG